MLTAFAILVIFSFGRLAKLIKWTKIHVLDRFGHVLSHFGHVLDHFGHVLKISKYPKVPQSTQKVPQSTFKYRTRSCLVWSGLPRPYQDNMSIRTLCPSGRFVCVFSKLPGQNVSGQNVSGQNVSGQNVRQDKTSASH